nr:MAG TPA: hypothetical protein [Bacteriophage sp.]
MTVAYRKIQHRGYKACVGNGTGRIRANEW